MMRKPIVAHLVLLASFALRAEAELDCSIVRQGQQAAGQDPAIQVAQLLVSQCLGGGNDKRALAKSIRQLLPLSEATSGDETIPEDSAEQVVIALIALQEDLRVAGEYDFSKYSEPERVRTTVFLLNAAIHETRAEVAKAGKCLPTAKLTPPLLPARFLVNPNGLKVGSIAGLDLASEVLAVACGSDSGSATCSDGLKLADRLATVATLAESTLTFYTNCYLEEAAGFAKVLTRKWNAYFDEARSQNPWELWLNDWILARSDKRPELNGNKLGSIPPPNYQVIWFHPSAGFEYVEKAPDGQQFEPTVLMELGGYNRWKYREDGSMGGALGASVIATVSDRADVEDIGYGLLLHINHKYSLGATRRNSQTGYVLSGDLSQLWLKASKEWRQRFTGK